MKERRVATTSKKAAIAPTRPHHASSVDPELKKQNLARLARIGGQVRGLAKMVEEDRYCPDIMVQVSSVQEALRSVSRELMKNHLEHCVTKAVRSGGDPTEMIGEILDLAFKHRR